VSNRISSDRLLGSGVGSALNEVTAISYCTRNSTGSQCNEARRCFLTAGKTASILNKAVRLVCGSRDYDHVTCIECLFRIVSPERFTSTSSGKKTRDAGVPLSARLTLGHGSDQLRLLLEIQSTIDDCSFHFASGRVRNRCL